MALIVVQRCLPTKVNSLEMFIEHFPHGLWGWGPLDILFNRFTRSYLHFWFKTWNQGPVTIKKILDPNLRYARFKHSDWLEILMQPVRILKTSTIKILLQFLFIGLGPILRVYLLGEHFEPSFAKNMLLGEFSVL